MSATPPVPSRLPLSLIWICSALSAGVLALGVSGTLSSWTQSVLGTEGNTVGTAGSPVLRVTGPDSTGSQTSCTSIAASDDAYSCTTVNIFGKNGVAQMAMQPGESHSTTLEVANVGKIDGATLGVAPGACTGSTDLCDALRVTVTCVGVGAATGTIGPMSLSAFATADRNLVGGLAAGGANSTCTVAMSLPVTAPPASAGQKVVQDVVWTLTA